MSEVGEAFKAEIIVRLPQNEHYIAISTSSIYLKFHKPRVSIVVRRLNKKSAISGLRQATIRMGRESPDMIINRAYELITMIPILIPLR